MTKEIIATAPVMVLLYDKTFVAGSFRAALQKRWKYYAGLAASWLLMACLMNLKQQAVGFGQGVTWWRYALTSCCSILLYLKLALWPRPLVFDYGMNITHTRLTTESCVLALAILLAATIGALWRRPAAGFVCAWFLVILAPTSSIVPIVGQPVAETRVYLSLAAVIALVVLFLFRLMGRRSFVVLACSAVGLGWLTVQRNEDYRSALAIWTDTVLKQPDGARAQNFLGMELENIPGELPDAISHFQKALDIQPNFAEAHSNLGMALMNMPERLPDAIEQFETALRQRPDFAIAHNNLGVALTHLSGRMPDAIKEFQAAVRLDPNYADARYNLAAARGLTSKTPKTETPNVERSTPNAE